MHPGLQRAHVDQDVIATHAQRVRAMSRLPELYQRDIERYEDRHRVRSGITGWAQVHGLRGGTALIERVEFDNFYVEHWSLSLDLKIMLLTIPALLRGS